MRHLPDGVFQWILHCVDHWSKFNFLYPLERKSAVCVAEPLDTQLFPYFGVPRILHSDNGREFISAVIGELLEKWGPGIQLISGRPRHPQSQGAVERAHATFQRKLSAEIAKTTVKKPEWSKWLSHITCKFLVAHYNISTLT